MKNCFKYCNESEKMKSVKNLGSIDIKPDHHFRYAREWDPRLPAHTKGGYLEGKIQLPKDMGNLRVVLSTVPATPLILDEDIIRRHPRCQEVHPTILFVVRIGRGKRMQEKEPVPNPHHWQQELHIVNRSVLIKNKTSDDDLPRYDKISEIPEMDHVCTLKNDMVLHLGKKSTELNLTIIIPKTQERSASGDLTINKIVKDRISDPDAIKSIIEYYRKKALPDSKKAKIKMEIYSLESNILLSSELSSTIFDKGSKHHQPIEFCHVFPLRGCALGGRKVIMVAENPIPKDVVPKFFMYDYEGKRIEEMDRFLIQPTDTKNPDNKLVSVMKETIIFITPPQPNIEMIMKNGWTIKLAGVRLSDGCESPKKYIFNYVPSDYYKPCIFCDFKGDGHDGNATLPEPSEISKTGKIKKIKPEKIKTRNIKTSRPVDLQTNTPLSKKMRLEDSNSCPNESSSNSCIDDPDSISCPGDPDSNSCPDDPDSNSCPSNLDSNDKPNLSLILSGTQKAISAQLDMENDIPPLVVTRPPGPMPGLIHLNQLQPMQNLHPHLKVEQNSFICDPRFPIDNLMAKEEITTSIMSQPKDPYCIKIEPEENNSKQTRFESFIATPFSSVPYFLTPVQSKNDTSRSISVIVKPDKNPEHPAKYFGRELKDSPKLKSYPVNLEPAEEKIPRRIDLRMPTPYPNHIPIPPYNIKNLSQREYELRLASLDNLDILDDNLSFLSHLQPIAPHPP
eukprot:GFUD01004696.1.p1 GENE.GFUD01004696.1~~GFUD01004696.1.p1  ORF type:complete len:733 (+),score=113.15 GFUD01004696.1:104-2302(+)